MRYGYHTALTTMLLLLAAGCASIPPLTPDENRDNLLQMVRRGAGDEEVAKYISDHETTYMNTSGICIGVCPMGVVPTDQFLKAIHAAAEDFKKQMDACKDDARCLANVKVLGDPDSGNTFTACSQELNLSDYNKERLCFVERQYVGGQAFEFIRNPENAISGGWISDELRASFLATFTPAAQAFNSAVSTKLTASRGQVDQEHREAREAWGRFRKAGCTTILGYRVVQKLGAHAYEIFYSQGFYLEKQAVLRTHHVDYEQPGTVIVGLYVRRGARKKVPMENGFAAEVYQLEETNQCKELGKKAEAIGGVGGRPLFGTGLK